MTTGERIRELRESRHLTQMDLANKCGVSKTTISMWESGSRMPSRLSMEALCDIFNVQMDYLRCRSDISMRYLDSEEMYLIDAYRSQPAVVREAVCRMLEVKKDE